MKTFLTSVAAVALLGSTAFAQGVVLVPQGQGPGGQQQYILVPVPQERDAEPGAGQQGAGQPADQQQARQRAESMALDLYRRGYQRGMADAVSRTGAAIDPAAMEQIGRELFERGYMLGLMQARAQMVAEEMPEPGDEQATAQQEPLVGATAEQQLEEAGEAAREMVQAPQDEQKGQAAQAATTEGEFPQAIIRTESSEQYGQYLVDANGRPVYVLEADRQGEGDQSLEPTCYDDCAEVWPPVLTQGTPPRALGEAEEGMLSTTEREDGTTQVTYDGWPLYYYVRDQAAERPAGQDVHDEWGEWYLLEPSGEMVHEE